MEKNNIDVDKFYENMKKADAETLVFLAKYSKKTQSLQRMQVFVSTIIATIAGAAVLASYVFPEMSKLSVGVGSAIFGLSTVVISYFQQKKEKEQLISKILKSTRTPSDEDLREAEKYRQDVLEIIEKEKKK
ncbi:TPA: hypothetical protein ACGUS9_004176 [Vibrio vulnificus]